MKIIYFFRALAANFRAELSARLSERRRARHRQHWQAGAVGGGAMVQLGHMTEIAALARLQNIKGDDEPIIYVDFERGFIAYGRMPESPNE